MSKCRHSSVPFALAVFALAACASAGRPALLGPPREQPAALVGRWAHDAGEGAPRETLVLQADGVEWIEAADGRRIAPRAWWWVERGPDDSAHLCLHWRAGRHRADCATFQLDAVRSGDAFSVRLRWASQSYVAVSAR